MRSRVVAVVGSAAILAVVLSACTKTTNQHTSTASVQQVTGGIDTNPKDSEGPAAPVAGATAGGTLTLLRQDDLRHLDPQRQYSLTGLSLSQLFARPLTEWKQDAKGGLVLVGDTATSTGTDVNKDCKTWKFTIKTGLKYQDGSAITAQDIAYGIARSFDPNLPGGPSYIQSWLANSSDFTTAWDFEKNKTSLPPGLTVPDPQTLMFSFQKPHCDLPFAASLPETAPVPAAKDTGTAYDNGPVSSGPYEITSVQRGKGITMVKNPNWDPKTDAVRHQYPDAINVVYGPDQDAQTNRLIADSGADQTAVALDGVAPDLTSKVLGDSTLATRELNQATPDLTVLDINNLRVSDLSVRQAINYAIDRQDYLKTQGGSIYGTPVTTLEPPQTIGYQSFDAYPAGPTGNIDKAKELLAGRTPTLVLATASDGDIADVTEMQQNLEKAGFKVIIKQDNEDNFFEDRENKATAGAWDLYIEDWIYDWPGGSSIFPILYDGRTIAATENVDTAYFNEPDVNAEIDRIDALPADQQGAQWTALDKMIMTKYAPVVPLYLGQEFVIYGSRVGGLYVSGTTGVVGYANAYVKAAS
jgi:peptide/nickel transport system substrate-binding protein